MKKISVVFFLLLCSGVYAQVNTGQENTGQENTDQELYKKRVLESAEIDFLGSYYAQDGNNASVSGGIGSEELTDYVGDIVVSIPLNDDDVLTVNVGISAYTSASSSNLNPFDGAQPADPFVASSGESRSDNLISFSGAYTHSSDDRNTIWGLTLSASSEYDYSSLGFGANLTKLFNEKNTELSVNVNVYIDQWNVLYPYELGGDADDDEGPFNINNYTVTGNQNYQPKFVPYDQTNRNSFTVGLGFSQIVSENAQMSLLVDLTRQEGLLANHMQRVYFSDYLNTFIENFHLADDVERLPNSRFKTAIGLRFNYYLNERLTLRSFYRYYFDDWDINSHTISFELPFKIDDKFTVYPSYRFYNQSAAKYFAPYDQHLSTNQYYTSDFDLSKYNANQYGMGFSYTNPFSKFRLYKFAFKSFDVRYDYYKRNTGLTAGIITGGIKFTFE